ncbi:MBL fold metallo-hydrolase [Halococcus salsus]|uniref:MBL fold metallo-hydrolase n=1 Tax=Halococcus salsus TaxID=2162894 RepID=UPI001356E059|nr:MBL fold metallo-hydrolase [Halococcus salsus]
MDRTTDWYGIASTTAGDYRLTETLNGVPSNAYLLTDGEERLVVDSGFGVGDLRSTCGELAGDTDRLLLTHTHWDHIGAGHRFDRAHVHPTESAEGEVRIDSLSEEFVGRPKRFVEEHLEAGGSLPDAVDPETFDVPPVTGVEPVEAGDVIELGDRRLELVDLAGHSPGQLGVLDRDRGRLYGGDLVHGDRNLYVHFRDCDVREYIESFERTIELREANVFSTLLTGHNPPIADEELSLLDTLRDHLESIVNGERTPETIETAWGEKHRYRIEGTEILTKSSV